MWKWPENIDHEFALRDMFSDPAMGDAELLLQSLLRASMEL